MKNKGFISSLWKKDREEGFLSILYKLLFLLLVFGLVLLFVLEKAGGGMGWMFSRFPILKRVAGELSPVNLYLFWLASLWVGFKIGKHVGTKRGAVNERRRLGIAF